MKIKVIVISLLAILINTASIGQSISDLNKEKMNRKHNYGIEGQKAPSLNVPIWIDENGKECTPINIDDYEGKFVVIYGFQAWCPGCHSQGLPALKKMTDALENNTLVKFLAIQTVFEGSQANTFERMKEIQKEYDLKIPFGHDIGNEQSRNISSTMVNYKTGGTPWFIFIDQSGHVVFNDYHLNTDNAISFLKKVTDYGKQ